MTLVLTAQGNAGLVQCSDRLIVTRRRGRPDQKFDDAANKSIILFTRDAVCVVGFAGVAYIDGIPAGRWLTMALAGTRPQNLEVHGAQFFGRQSRHRIAPLLWNLERKLEKAKMKLRRLQVSVMGYRLHRGLYFPISYYIDVPHSVKKQNLRRDLYKGTQIGVLHVGADVRRRQISEAFAKHPQASALHPDGVRAALTDVIREVSKANSSVGSDVMSVSIDINDYVVRVEFMSDAKWNTEKRRGSDDEVLSAANMMFASAIVAPDFVCHPVSTTSDLAVEVGRWRVEIAGSTLPQPAGLVMLVDYISDNPPEP